MTARAHVALWIAAVVVALVVVPLAPDAQGARAMEARTRSVLARVDSRIAAVAASRANAITSAWADAPAIDRRAEAPRDPAVVRDLLPRWRATWRIVFLRLALMACAGVAWMPIVAAGAVDGLALRRARRSRLAAASPVGIAVGVRVSIAVAFAPVMWAALPLDAEPIALVAWALIASATLSFTLSRAGAVGAS